MSKEQYVSYEVAKLLKEKKFVGDCVAYYNSNGRRVLSIDADIHPLPCPTQQMACRWLREEKHYHIQPMLDGWALGEHSGYYIVIMATDSDFELHAPMKQVFFDTYEDAVEAALKYVLTNLI